MSFVTQLSAIIPAHCRPLSQHTADLAVCSLFCTDVATDRSVTLFYESFKLRLQLSHIQSVFLTIAVVVMIYNNVLLNCDKVSTSLLGFFNNQRPIMSDQNAGWSDVISYQVFRMILNSGHL